MNSTIGQTSQQTTITSAINIDNAGSISAGNLFAIETDGASTTVTNRAAGVITGFVDLSDEDDLFDNQAGSVFEARLTSDFGGGDDLFTNEGIVHAVASGGTQPSFVNLERFENSGLISTVNGRSATFSPCRARASSSTQTAARRLPWMPFSASPGRPRTISSSTAM